ncbi:MAG: DUF3037 domain-containing protein [Flavipsychrobacter sp.]|nr:DUF3037 domain-containing protein [Flavipsychrobacter sp.]
MKTLQYQVLRYLPDRVSGEFVNLGVVLYDAQDKILRGKFISKIGMISEFFPEVNSRYLIKCIKSIQQSIAEISRQLESEFEFEKYTSLDGITKQVLPKDDSALIFSEVKRTLDINAEVAVRDLFSRFVRIHVIDEDDEIRRDKEVWNKVYKKHFDENGITKHFQHHKVKTQNDELEFDKAWKNGAWNCFESVSFNLNRPDAIKNKVYKWVGKLDELSSATEPVHIYLLSVLPHEHPELNNFITKKIQSKSTDKTKIEIISEEQLEMAAKKIKQEIEQHIQS